MTKLKTILLAIILIGLFFRSNLASAQTQSQMNYQASSGYEKAEKELNLIYQQILNEYTSDTTFIKNLNISQRLWNQFREAEVKLKYPDKEFTGSAEPMCKALYLEELTWVRIKTLKVWVDGVEEGDICNGSIKNK